MVALASIPVICESTNSSLVCSDDCFPWLCSDLSLNVPISAMLSSLEAFTTELPGPSLEAFPTELPVSHEIDQNGNGSLPMQVCARGLKISADEGHKLIIKLCLSVNVPARCLVDALVGIQAEAEREIDSDALPLELPEVDGGKESGLIQAQAEKGTDSYAFPLELPEVDGRKESGLSQAQAEKGTDSYALPLELAEVDGRMESGRTQAQAEKGTDSDEVPLLLAEIKSGLHLQAIVKSDDNLSDNSLKSAKELVFTPASRNPSAVMVQGIWNRPVFAPPVPQNQDAPLFAPASLNPDAPEFTPTSLMSAVPTSLTSAVPSKTKHVTRSDTLPLLSTSGKSYSTGPLAYGPHSMRASTQRFSTGSVLSTSNKSYSIGPLASGPPSMRAPVQRWSTGSVLSTGASVFVTDH